MNIQQLIIKGIKEQLFLNNYLVLPDFGGFVLRFNPAHFSGAGTFLLSPSKTVSFNAQLKQNDGLLAMWLQANLNCTAIEALTHLQEFAAFCKGVLNTRRRLSLDTIGFFYLDFENNVCFEPQPDSNFLTSSFGLAPVSIKELAPEVNETKKETVFVDRTLHMETTAPVQKQKRNYTRVVIPAVLTILFLSGLLLFVSTTQFNGQLKASLFSGNQKAVYMPLNYADLLLAKNEADNAAYVADANGIANMALENNKTIAVNALNITTKSTAVTHLRSNEKLIKTTVGKFEIVLGCFTVLENANRMLGKLSKQNIDAFVSEKNNKGMYVVANGLFETKESAIAGLDKLKGTYPKAWIKQPE